MSRKWKRRACDSGIGCRQTSLPGTDPLMGYAEHKGFLFRDVLGQRGNATVVQGDALDAIVKLAAFDVKVDCWITSPPYFRKIDYGVEGQLGLEETADDYVGKQKNIAATMLRASAPHANLFYVIQDSYNQTGGSGGDYITDGEYRMKVVGPREEGWPRKAYLGIPWQIVEAFQGVGWCPILDIIWDKQDARRGAADRPSLSYEHVLLFSANPDHYWDADAVLQPYSKNSLAQLMGHFNGHSEGHYEDRNQENPCDVKRNVMKGMDTRPGARLRAIWKIHPGRQPRVELGSGEKHKGIASFPLLLPEICVLLGCPPGGLVGDPFCGFGTALRAAVKWGRNAWGNDLDPKSVEATQILLAQDGRE